jgi:hypothetical protein
MNRLLDHFFPGRPTMRKFSIYFACFFTLILMGCGDTSGDPTARITLEADSTTVSPGDSTVITATVTKAVGKKAEATAEATAILEPGWGENVTFRLLTANGGQLSTPIQKTDGDGKARSVYTAGNNYNNDTIQATLDNGMYASIVITKSGNLKGATISSLVASPAAVAEGQTSIITAKVTDGGSSNPMIGEAVTFTIATNESGACFINATNACVTSVAVNSDAGGNAVAIYRAGGDSPTVSVYDTVRATLASGSTSAVVITRSAGTAGSIVTVTANPTSIVKSTGVSLVTANVKDSNGAVVNGASVNFTRIGTGMVGTSPVTTDGAGNAVTTYTAGGVAGSDVVTATVTIGGVIYTGAVTITITP